MTLPIHPKRRPNLLALAGCSAPLLALAASLAALSISPAPAAAAFAEPHLHRFNSGELSASAACASPAPGYARCASEKLIFRAGGAPVRFVSPSGTAAPPAPTGAAAPASSGGVAGYSPGELQSAYNLTSLITTQGAGETIALVDAYDDPSAEVDLKQYRSEFGLPACTTANGCFHKAEQSGIKASPSNDDWSLEVSLDLDMASAICPKCNILLEESKNNYLPALAAAAHEAAATPGVVAVSNSYTLSESELYPSWTAYEGDYTHAGVAFTAASGDAGYAVNFPAVMSTVTAVGGTSLQLSGGAWSQTAWEKTGAGCSQYVARPEWQKALGATYESGCSKRSDNDVSADANPNTGAAVYDTFNGNGGWEVVGGTSEASPIIAGFYALIGQEAGVGGAAWDYSHLEAFKDVVGGLDENGCSSYLCEAVLGYDGPTGLGTPEGNAHDTASGQKGTAGEPSPAPAAPTTAPPTSPGTNSSSQQQGTSAPGTGSGHKPAGALARLSALALTARAMAALNGPAARLFQVGFRFTSSAPVGVRVTLARQVVLAGHKRWRKLPQALTIHALRGGNSHRLSGTGTLARGSYRLTLTPVHGAARSLVFRIR